MFLYFKYYEIQFQNCQDGCIKRITLFYVWTKALHGSCEAFFLFYFMNKNLAVGSGKYKQGVLFQKGGII